MKKIYYETDQLNESQAIRCTTVCPYGVDDKMVGSMGCEECNHNISPISDFNKKRRDKEKYVLCKFEEKLDKQIKILENFDRKYSFTLYEGFYVNFDKIKDDLSYAEPMCVVNIEGNKGTKRTFVVVHHSIYDKYYRSKMNGTLYKTVINKLSGKKKFIDEPPEWLEKGYQPITDHRKIGFIKDHIFQIKNAPWRDEEFLKEKVTSVVTVKKVKI